VLSLITGIDRLSTKGVIIIITSVIMFIALASVAYNDYQDHILEGEEQKKFVTRGCTVSETNWLGSPTDWNCQP
jgi:hypothetical protein